MHFIIFQRRKWWSIIILQYSNTLSPLTVSATVKDSSSAIYSGVNLTDKAPMF
ncbi:hypothetical protein Fmac_017248 [Flemingia macrophylla]|uniref:Uncharacterized protein n=1 Tax=Flemingia macrophylla TaxID=520843 RepID=A0ABD1M1J8_9FABA